MKIFNTAQAKHAAKALEKFFTSKQVSVSQSTILDGIAVASGLKDWNAMSALMSESGVSSSFSTKEHAHYLANRSASYGPEVALVAQNGFELRFSASTDSTEYVRICDPYGREVGHWSCADWALEPAEAMTEILLSLLRGSAKALSTNSAVLGTPKRKVSVPAIAHLPFDTLVAISFNGEYCSLKSVDYDRALLLKAPIGALALENSATHIVLEVSASEATGEALSSFTVAYLRTLRWDASKAAFIDLHGNCLEFHLGTSFTPTSQHLTKSGDDMEIPAELLEFFEPTLPLDLTRSVDLSALTVYSVHSADTPNSPELLTLMADSDLSAEAKAVKTLHMGSSMIKLVACDAVAMAPFYIYADNVYVCTEPNIMELRKRLSSLSALASDKVITVESHIGDTLWSSSAP